ncbi:MAG TPA: fibronectin type III domain-containing protein [Candidatus Dormibacteraeota bacterium]|nr:fibronectin type III domain-containing protein [Candidatus Dormibacteraeota bacterium]
MWGGIRRPVVNASIALLLAALAGLQLPGNAPVTARAATTFDNAAAEQQLFDLINQDRAQNGLGALVANPTLFNIARGAPHQVCANGQTYNGRAQDMIERQYFSHQIPPCGSYVWPVLTTYGVQWTQVGENIAWNNYSPQSTSVINANTAFMNSAGHRANILGAYNQVGVGAFAAPGPWSDGNGGGPWDGVLMYVEIFVNGPLPVPGAPTNVVAAPGDGAATVSWAAPFLSSLGIGSYVVTPYVNGTTAGAPIVFGAGSTTVLFPGLTNGTGYTFTVTATNGAGSSPPSAPSNLVVPSGIYPHMALSNAQYQLAGSNGSTWTDIDPANLAFTVTPSVNSWAILGGNADLWTATAGYNQDLGISVNGSIVAWKESGGFAGTFSPNAAFVNAVVPMSAGTSYLVKLQWKTNKPAPGVSIFAGAGSAPSYSPTRLTAALVPLSAGTVATKVAANQYALVGSNGSAWTDMDTANLTLSYIPTTSGTAVLSGNADLWTASPGYNQDLGIAVNGSIAGWKESGGFAGTFSPNAAYVETAVPMSAGVPYTVKLQWKTNKPAPGATILAGAGSGPYSPTRLSLRFYPSGTGVLDRASAAQYYLVGSDGVNWTDVDASNLSLSYTPSSNCIAILSGNADLFTSRAGFNQDLGIDVNGTVAGWKESGGFAGIFSPNAAYVQTVVPLSAGTIYTIKLRWKTNIPAPAATIYAGAGSSPYSPTRITAELYGC